MSSSDMFINAFHAEDGPENNNNGAVLQFFFFVCFKICSDSIAKNVIVC